MLQCKPPFSLPLLFFLCLSLSSVTLAASALLEADFPQIRNCTGRLNEATFGGSDGGFLSVNDPSATCKEKMTIQVVVGANLVGDLGRTFFYQSAIGPGGFYDVRTFEGFYVRIVRRQVVIRHELTYLGNFNAKPYETPVQDSNCNSEFNPNMATCGLAADGNGSFIPLSQGFCCDCTECYNGTCSISWRANACSSKTTKVGACLRMNALSYAGYRIDPTPKLAYVLQVSVWGNVSDYITENVFTRGRINTSVIITPDVPAQYNSTDQVLVLFENKTLDQSTGSATIITNITKKDLFVPATPADDERVLAGAKEWMFLERDMVSVDGSECNKVGTSYRAFATQVNACELNVGTCLNSQLDDLRTADLAVMKMGTLGSFLGPNYGNFSLQTAPNGTEFLTYPTTAKPANAIIDVVLNADRLVSLASPVNATITAVTVSPAREAQIPAQFSQEMREYDTLTGVVSGGVFVGIRSTGDSFSHFQVAIDNCSDAIDAAALYPLWISMKGWAVSNVTLLVKSKPAARINTYVQCTVNLFNCDGNWLRSHDLRWALTDTGFQLTAPGTPAPTKPNMPDNNDGDGDDACNGCGFFTVARTFRQNCVKFIVANVVVLLVVFGATLLLIYLVWLCVEHCCLSSSPAPSRVGEKRRRTTPEFRQARAEHPHRSTATKNPPNKTPPPTYASRTTPQSSNLNQPSYTQSQPLTPEEIYLQQQMLYQQELLRQQQQQAYAAAASAQANHTPYGNEDSLSDSVFERQMPYFYTNVNVNVNAGFPNVRRAASASAASAATSPQQLVVEEIHTGRDSFPLETCGPDESNGGFPQHPGMHFFDGDNDDVEEVVPLACCPTPTPDREQTTGQRKGKGYTTNLADIDEDDDVPPPAPEKTKSHAATGSDASSRAREPFV